MKCKNIVLYYPIYCRHKLRGRNKWVKAWVDGELECGYALGEMMGAFRAPVEELMLYVATLILAVGSESDEANNVVLPKIKSLIKEFRLEELLGRVSGPDSAEIRSALELLGVL